MVKTKVVDLVELIILVVLRGSNSFSSWRYDHIKFFLFPKGFCKENPAGGHPERGAWEGVWRSKNHEKMTFPKCPKCTPKVFLSTGGAWKRIFRLP